MKNEEIKNELKFCLQLWETKGYCEFGSKTNCKECAAPYILWKLISGEVLHGKEIKRLTIEDWKTKLKSIES